MSFSCKTFILFICFVISNVLCNKICEPNAVSKSSMICDNTCTTCIMKCSYKDSCIQSIMISGAMNTYIYCDGEQSCKESIITIGNNDILSPYYQREYNSLYILCTNNNSCSHFNVNISGNFVNNGIIITNITSLYGSYQSKNGQIDVQLNEQQLYVLHCDMISCNGLKVICYSGNCMCNGDCSSMINGGIITIINQTTTTNEPILTEYIDRNISITKPLTTKNESLTSLSRININSSDNPTIYYLDTNISNTIEPSLLPTYNPTIFLPNPSFIPTEYSLFNTTQININKPPTNDEMFIKKYLKTIIGLGLSVLCCFTLSRILCKQMFFSKLDDYKNNSNNDNSESESETGMDIENKKHPNYFESSIQDSFLEDQINEMTTALKTCNNSRDYNICNSSSDITIESNPSRTLINRNETS